MMLGLCMDVPQDVASVELLRDDCLRNNMHLLPSLREDPQGEELHRLAREDAALGRMTWPVPASEVDMEELRLHPRFAVEQGQKQDGSAKVRAIDHLSWSAGSESTHKRKRSKQHMKEASVNGHCAMSERIHHEHLDRLIAAARRFIMMLGMCPGIWKADIDAAFRCDGSLRCAAMW